MGGKTSHSDRSLLFPNDELDLHKGGETPQSVIRGRTGVRSVEGLPGNRPRAGHRRRQRLVPYHEAASTQNALTQGLGAW